MSDWQVGDLAVCVDDSPCRCGRCGGLPIYGLRAGKSYTVTAVDYSDNSIETDRPPSRHSVHRGLRWCAMHRFRKILPDKHETGRECEQLLALLRRAKKPVSA